MKEMKMAIVSLSVLKTVLNAIQKVFVTNVKTTFILEITIRVKKHVQKINLKNKQIMYGNVVNVVINALLVSHNLFVKVVQKIKNFLMKNVQNHAVKELKEFKMELVIQFAKKIVNFAIMINFVNNVIKTNILINS